jgi:predicted kinase
MLIVFSGLPGVGKTTIARELACSLAAVYLRQAGLAVTNRPWPRKRTDARGRVGARRR